MDLSPKRSVILKLVLFSCGYFLTYGAYYAILFLQSSINIEGGVGALSATVTYVSSAVLGIFFTPVAIRVLGAKQAVIVCQICYLLYVLANFYPVSYLLIPASVATGFGEATMWPNMILFSVHFARCYARHGSKKSKTYETEFVGYFFMGFQLSQIFANMLTYAILYGGRTPINETQSSDNASTTDPPITVLPVSTGLLVCGANDCQDPNVTAANITNYVPTSTTILNIVIGVMAAMIVAAVAVHSIFTKPIDESLEGKEEKDTASEDDKCQFRKIGSVELKRTQQPEELNISDMKDTASVTYSLGDQTKQEDKWRVAFSTVKATLRHLLSPTLLLVAPFAIYSGVLMSFGYSELTRAYASCMIGVDQVGLCMAIFAAAGGISSVCITKLASRVGYNIPMAIGFVLDIGGYMICLFWVPTEDSLWIVYLIFTVVGIVNGIWQPLINEIHGWLFPEIQDIAFSVWNILVLAGFAIQYGWSTVLCVYLKIYIQIGMLCISVLCYVVAIHTRKMATG